MTERSEKHYGLAKIHFDNDVELHDIIVSLIGYQRLYAELAWIDSILEEIWELQKIHGEDFFTSEKLIRVALASLLEVSTNPNFDPEYAIRNTRSALRVGTARDSGSWLVELVGKINPIKAVEQLAVLVRDWKSTKEKNHLENSKIAQELMAMELENKVREIGVLGHAINLLESHEIDSKEITSLIHGRIKNITQGSLYINHSTKKIEIVAYDESAGVKVAENEQAITLQRATDSLNKQISVWDQSNKLISRKEDA